MLVMMLRTVTAAEPCAWCSSCTAVSAVVSLRRQMLVEPGQRGRDPGILVTQPVHKLDGECARQAGALRIREHHGGGLRDAIAGTEQAVGETICPLPRGAAVHDQVGEAPEIFDQHDPERDADRPEFADRQRLHVLVSAHETAQHFGIVVAVGVRDEGPGQAEHTRIAGERSIRELGQLPIVTGRQRGADFTNLPLDEVIIIDQPIGCRCQRAAFIDRSGNDAVGMQQYRAVVSQATGQGMAPARPRGNRLGNSETSRMLFEAFDAEQFSANGVAAEPR